MIFSTNSEGPDLLLTTNVFLYVGIMIPVTIVVSDRDNMMIYTKIGEKVRFDTSCKIDDFDIVTHHPSSRQGCHLRRMCIALVCNGFTSVYGG